MHFCVSLLTSGLTHSRPRSRWPRTAYISVLAQSHRSMPPSLWRHRRARVIAHHTSPLYLLLLLLVHPSVPSLPPPFSLFPLPQGALCECSIYSEIFSLPLFLSLISPSICFFHFFLFSLLEGGSQCECCIVIQTRFLSLPPLLLLYLIFLKKNIV